MGRLLLTSVCISQRSIEERYLSRRFQMFHFEASLKEGFDFFFLFPINTLHSLLSAGDNICTFHRVLSE